MKITLATSSQCGPCYALKSKIEKLGLIVDTKDYIDQENIEWFKKHQIRSVPRLVIEKDDSVEIIQGMDEIIQIITNNSKNVEN
jgi:glutaredoxin